MKFFELLGLALIGLSCVCCVSAEAQNTNAPAPKAPIGPKMPVNIGSRTELMMDDWLIESQKGVSLQLQTPHKEEIVWQTEKPWEGTTATYFTIFQDGPIVRLYYRGARVNDSDITCYAESKDGIHFTKPNLGIYEFEGSKNNNIILMGSTAHNFAPFKDLNPACKPGEKYKAIGGDYLDNKDKGVFAFSSADGIHWKQMGDPKESIITKGKAFDSHNVAFYDPAIGKYRMFSRIYIARHRAVQSATSTDFLHWSEPEANVYPEGTPIMHLYTNATHPVPGAPHMLVSMPMRLNLDRRKDPVNGLPGVSDSVFMSSRDGVNWDRTFLGSWIKAGPDPRNWTDRNILPAWGILQTSPSEYSVYTTEHYRWPDVHLQRYTVRRDGFVARHAEPSGGEFTTRPLIFTGKNLILNYSTSALGYIRVEVQDEAGRPIPGYTLEEMDAFYGDELDYAAKWKTKADLSELRGRTVRFRFVMMDADLYSLRTGEAVPVPAP